MSQTTSFKPAATKWKFLRTWDGTDDDDWANDVSDALPADADTAEIVFHRGEKVGDINRVEFVVIAYVAATGLLVDVATQTYSCDVTFINDPPDGSSIVGRTTSGEQIATRLDAMTSLNLSHHQRFNCDGADRVALRLHTLSAAPAGADAYDVWYREVYE